MKSMAAAFAIGLLGVVAGVVFLWPSQRTGTEAIVYGRDACAHCRMHISQAGFAGEMRDRDGVLTKYDDVGCMLQAMAAKHREIPEVWVEDHDGNGFVPLLTAQLVHDPDGRTPMGYGIVAFATAAAAATYAQSHGGQLVSLEDILSEPGRWARGAGMGRAENKGEP